MLHWVLLLLLMLVARLLYLQVMVLLKQWLYRSQTRTWTARDACGNTSTASRTVTWTSDNTPPVITTGGTTNTLVVTQLQVISMLLSVLLLLLMLVARLLYLQVMVLLEAMDVFVHKQEHGLQEMLVAIHQLHHVL